MKRRLAAAIALSTIFVVGIGAAVVVQLKVEPDKENIVASRLIGSWTPDEALTKHLGGTPINEFGNSKNKRLTFTEDPTIAGQIPAKFNEFLKREQIFLAGKMGLGDDSYPFILIALKGNPHVVIFMPRDGKPMDNAESFNVMLPVAKDTANDLLFIGGDFNNQPFSAYKRAKKDE